MEKTTEKTPGTPAVDHDAERRMRVAKEMDRVPLGQPHTLIKRRHEAAQEGNLGFVEIANHTIRTLLGV